MADDGETLFRSAAEAAIRFRHSVCFAGGARWRDRWVMRISVIGWPTTEQDGARSVDAILAAWRGVC